MFLDKFAFDIYWSYKGKIHANYIFSQLVEEELPFKITYFRTNACVESAIEPSYEIAIKAKFELMSDYPSDVNLWYNFLDRKVDYIWLCCLQICYVKKKYQC